MKLDWRHGMPDDFDELIRMVVEGIRATLHTSFPVVATEDTDGHTVKLKIAVQGQKRDEDGKFSNVDYPTLETIPVQFPGGGGKPDDYVMLTHPVKVGKDDKDKEDLKKSDEGIIIIGRSAIDNWHKDGGVQPAYNRRTHHLSDAMFVPGLRSTPNKHPHHANDALQARSHSKKHGLEIRPKTNPHAAGFRAWSVETMKSGKEDKDPSEDENAKKFYDQRLQAEVGVRTRAVNDSTTHKAELTHDAGHVHDVKNGKHKSTVHPDDGVALSAEDGKHKVEALTSQVKLTSDSKVESVAPITSASQDMQVGRDLTAARDVSAERDVLAQGKLAAPLLQAALAAIGGITGTGGGALNSGGGANSGVGAGAMQTGAAAANVGALSGDLSGTLPAPTVVGVHLAPRTVAALPTNEPAGTLAYVTDGAAALAWGVTVTGGGSAKYLVWYNGDAWTVAGK